MGMIWKKRNLFVILILLFGFSMSVRVFFLENPQTYFLVWVDRALEYIFWMSIGGYIIAMIYERGR